MKDLMDSTGSALGVIIGTCTVIGLAAKFILLPWLEKNLVKPVKETNTQVSVNNNVSDPATMLDTVHNIEKKLEKMEDVIHQLALSDVTIGSSTNVIQKMWDHHLEWSENEVNRIWIAISKLETKDEDH